MRELLKSFFSFSWAMSLFGVRSLGKVLSPEDGDDAAAAIDRVTRAAEEQLGEELKEIFERTDEMQRDIVDRVLDAAPGAGGRSGRAASRKLDTARFVVLGGGLSAGFGHFSLSQETQRHSFGAQMARRVGTTFHQPLLQAPGVGGFAGFAEQPIIIPTVGQGTVLVDFPGPAADLGNISVPGFRLVDAVDMRPQAPLVRRRDGKQTLTNLILGLPEILESHAEGPTQLEYACRRKPTLALVEHGFQEALDAALAGDAGKLPGASAFQTVYTQVLRELTDAGAKVVATTIPDPTDTAHFSTLETAAKILKTEAEFLRARYRLQTDDLIHLQGLIDIGYQFTARQIDPSRVGQPALGGAAAERLRDGIGDLNAAIRAAAEETGALVYDLHAFLARVARNGIKAGDRRLSAEFLGGFYLLNGVYPGPTGHALLANDLLEFLNEEFEARFRAVDVAKVAAGDANTMARLAPGPTFTDEFLEPRTPKELPPPPRFDPLPEETPIQTVYPGLQPGKDKCEPAVGLPAAGFSDPKLDKPLELPAGLEQTLELDPAGSYFGDALRAVDCPDDQPLFPNLPAFGICANTLFGGLALTDSHLRGKIHVKFSPPDENNVSHFEITHPGGLMGEDGTLAAPLFFKLPSQLQMVQDVEGLVSSGDLHLDTGQVTNFHYNVLFFNTAIMSLFGVNPNLPSLPMMFPGAPGGGSTWARFDQRRDGRLDVTLAANMFLPLGLDAGGDPVRFPLPFANPRLQCASIVARGTSLHPHIHLTTAPSTGGGKCPEIPYNTVQEYTPFSHNTSFGDEFTLEVEEWGGDAVGRAHLLGRVRVQFGIPSGTSVPFAVSVLPPGGLLTDDPVPLPYLPPGTGRGLIGFNELLKTPSGLEYPQSKLANADDPFNLCVGAIDLRTGKVLDELLLRGYVLQALYMALLAVEPCTPADSFNYQGPASFERGPSGETVFRFDGTVYVPYPKGFRFPSPSPDGKPPFVVQSPSRLDPFRRIQAMSGGERFTGELSGSGDGVSSIGQSFSYRYSIPGDPAGKKAEFEYTNHTAGGTFKLESLSWVGFSHSRGSRGRPDTVSFTGFGSWSEDSGDGLHQVAVQISTAAKAPYVGIQVDGGRTSNVNTKPKSIEDTLP